MYLPIHLIKRAEDAPVTDATETAESGNEETEWSSYVTYGACALAALILLVYIYWRWRVLNNPARSSWRQGKCLCVECRRSIDAQAEADQRLRAKGIKRTELEEDDWRQQAANTTATVPNLFWGNRTYRHAECAEMVRSETLGR